MRNEELVKEYAEKLKPLMPMAHKAYGAKNQKTPAHIASQEYTRLLKEFHSLDGSLLFLDYLKVMQIEGRLKAMSNGEVSNMRQCSSYAFFEN